MARPLPQNVVPPLLRAGQAVALGRTARWCRAELAGRLAELSGRGAAATLSLAALLVRDAQAEGEPVAWIAVAGADPFYPPDLATLGVDLAALPVVRVPDPRAAGRAASHLVRSGGFGLVVLDLGPDPELPLPLQARLVRMAQQHETALLCLTEKGPDAPSLGSLVSLRGEATRARVGEDRFRIELRVLKDKRRGPGWRWAEELGGPPGLR